MLVSVRISTSLCTATKAVFMGTRDGALEDPGKNAIALLVLSFAAPGDLDAFTKALSKGSLLNTWRVTLSKE